MAYPDDAREEYGALREENDEIDRRKTELEQRQAYLERIAHRGQERREGLGRGTSRAHRRSANATSTTSPPCRWTPSVRREGRSWSATGRSGRSRWRGSPTPGGISRERAQEHIAMLLDLYDTPDAQLARRILKTGSPQYRSAFRAWMSGRPMSQEEQRAFTLGSTGMPMPYKLDPTVIPVSNGRSTRSVRSPTWSRRGGERVAREPRRRRSPQPVPQRPQRRRTTRRRSRSRRSSAPASRRSCRSAWRPRQDWPGMDAGMARVLADAKDDEEATRSSPATAHRRTRSASRSASPAPRRRPPGRRSRRRTCTSWRRRLRQGSVHGRSSSATA